MNNALLDIVQGSNGSYYFENAAESLIYTVIGLVVVLVGMALLIAILYLVGFIIKKIVGAKLPKHGKKGVAPEAVAPASEEEVPDEVKAAIVAAIMAYYVKEKPQCDFVVKKIKRL